MAITTWDPAKKSASAILSNNNLTAQVFNTTQTVLGTTGKTTGKWYFEVTINSYTGSYSNRGVLGIGDINTPTTSQSIGYAGIRSYGGEAVKDPGSIPYGSSLGAGNIVGIMVDKDTGTLTFSKNGVSQGVSHTNINSLGEVFPYFSSRGGDSGWTITANFGATAFSFPPPKGYTAWNKDREDVNQKKIILPSTLLSTTIAQR